jgi:hypothetical protein
MDDPHVNAASAGGGEFYVTTGLLLTSLQQHLFKTGGRLIRMPSTSSCSWPRAT